MHIIYLHMHFSTPRMAGGSFSFEWARRLVDHGHEVHMVAAERTGKVRHWYRTREAGIDVHWAPVKYSNHMNFKRRVVAFMEFAWASARRAVKLPGDVVIATSTPLTMSLPGVRVARKKNIPMVFEIADLWPELPIAMGVLKDPISIGTARWLEQLAYRNAAHIVAQSPGVKDGVVATGYPSEKVTVIPSSCDPARFQVSARLGEKFRAQHEWLGDRPLVVYTGTMGPINGVDYLARVAAAAWQRDPDVRFLVVGGGREEEKVRQTAAQLGVLNKNFFMMPPVPKQEVPAVISAADICTSVFIDLKEMWANNAAKVFDAMAGSRPFAINHEGWLAELIRDHDCGLVLDVNNPTTSAEQLIGAVRNRSWLDQAGAAAWRLGQERFDRDRMAERFESILYDVVPGQQRPAALESVRNKREKELLAA